MRSTVLAVALVGVLLLAGCSGSPGGVGTSPTATDTQTDAPTPTETETATDTPTTTPTTATHGAYNAFRFEATPVTPERIAEQLATPFEDLDGDERDLATAALANLSASDVVLSHGDRVPESPGTLQDGEFLRRNGTYYRVNATVIHEISGEGYPFSLAGPLRERHDDYDVAREEAVPVDSLTATQRDLFEYGVPSGSRREEATTFANFYYLPPEDGRLDDSGWLDGNPHYVRQDGDLFRVRYGGNRNPTVVRMRVQYSLEPVAQSASAFVEPRLEDVVVNVTDDDPADPARSVVLSAIEDGLHEWEGAVETRPRSVERASEWVGENSPEGSYVYVRYEGDLYRIQVTEVIE